MLFPMSSKPKLVTPTHYPFFIKQNRVCQIGEMNGYGEPLYVTLSGLKAMSPEKMAKTVLLYACSGEPTFGKGGAGFEFYFFADGTSKLWRADGQPYTGKRHPANPTPPPYATPESQYPRWKIKFQLLANMDSGSDPSDYLHGWLFGVNEAGEWVTDNWKVDCHADAFDHYNHTIFQYPMRIFVGALPRKNFSGWRGLDQIKINSVTTGE